MGDGDESAPQRPGQPLGSTYKQSCKCCTVQDSSAVTHAMLVGELFDRIVKAGRFVEDEARYFFQQVRLSQAG